MKKKIIVYLDNQTSFFSFDYVSDVFTASKIAEIFHVKRNTISHYLNQLTSEGKLIKVNSRPVFYLSKKTFEEENFKLKKNIYSSFQEILNEKPYFKKERDFFSLMIGHNQSLNRAIDQIKMSLAYPNNGLPVLITGESGTGKSYLVRLVYEYCIENDILKEDAPFITLNCAQYANNPELLTSNLFGYVKGAFTGANETQQGIFESANEGILFLDEVHRLNAEAQEKLFTYLDQHIIYRLGDNSHPLHVNTRLFFATTEDLESNFLTTFIRRIPIQITLPSIKERSRNERIELIYSFFIAERHIIQKDISISSQVINLLAGNHFKGNIGELKNCVKVTVAKAFMEQKSEQVVNISIHYLPSYLLRDTEQLVYNIDENKILIKSDTTLQQMIKINQLTQKSVIETFEKVLLIYRENHQDLSICEEEIKKHINKLFDELFFSKQRYSQYELLVYVTQYIRETFRQMRTAYGIQFNGNSVYALSYYLLQRGSTKWYAENDELSEMITHLNQEIKVLYPDSYHYVSRILNICQPLIDLDITLMDYIILTLYFKKIDWKKEQGIPKAIIVAHGYATASSISNVVNRLLEKEIFEAFDMPLETTAKQISEEIIDYCTQNDLSNGLIILVDMGSLKELYQYFPKQIETPIVVVNNVSTPLALSIGENIQKKLSFEEMIEQSVDSAKLDWEIIYPQENRKKVLLTVCQTGIGTAKQINQLLEKSLPVSCDLKIMPYSYESLHVNKKDDTIFSVYDVLGIVGTENPNIENLMYVSLEELISGQDTNRLMDGLSSVMTKEEKDLFNKRIIRSFSLEKVIQSVTILDTDKVIHEIEDFFREIEFLFNLLLGNNVKIALYVHISCLIERLIRNIPIETYSQYDELAQCHQRELSLIKKAFSVIESDYSVNVPNSEVAYVYDIIFKKSDISMIESDF